MPLTIVSVIVLSEYSVDTQLLIY